MPRRLYTRDQEFLLPPNLGDYLSPDHPVRFVAAFIDTLSMAELGIPPEPAIEGAPSYDPRMLLAVWVYGFMVRLRSSRKLERACQENVCFMWLCGMQRPDHTSLSRFYNRYRQALRPLFRHTVELAVSADLTDFALQAIDGTRVTVAKRESMKTRTEIEALLRSVDGEIAAMERAQGEEQESDDEPGPPSPQARKGKEEMRSRLQRALTELSLRETESRGEVKDGRQKPHSTTIRVSISDPDAVLVGRKGQLSVGYNGQVVADGRAQIIVAAEVVAMAADTRELEPMCDEVHAMSGRQPEALCGDAGYHSAHNIEVTTARGIAFYAPDPQLKRRDNPKEWPYHKDHFAYEASSDSLVCPEGRHLPYVYVRTQDHGRPIEGRVYRGEAQCANCPANRPKGCTTSPRGRAVVMYGHELAIQDHRVKMRSEEGHARMRQRKAIVEPIFALIREQLGLGRFLLRGLENVQGEWRLLCSACNLRKIWAYWWRPRVLAQAAC